MKNHDIIEISARVWNETDKALLLFDGDKKVWVPKSQVEDHEDGTFSLPEWLALEKGLI